MKAFNGPVYFGANPANGTPLFSIDVNAVAFTLGSFEVRWYGIFIALGILLAILYANFHARKFGVDPDKLIDVAIGSIIVGIIGARAYYVVFNFDEYRNNLWDIFKINEGGLAIYGGIVFGLLAGYLFCKLMKIRFLAGFDLAGLGFLIGQCLGRWGNFANQEAFGSNTTLPWGMYSSNTQNYLSMVKFDLADQGIIVDPTLPVHPCFLYESLWCLIGFIALHFFAKRKKYDGQICLMYVAWYGLGRFWIEGLRTDSLMIGPFRVSQLLAALLVLASVTILVWLHKIKYNNVFGEEGLKLQLAQEAEAKELAKAQKANKPKVEIFKKKENKFFGELLESEEEDDEDDGEDCDDGEECDENDAEAVANDADAEDKEKDE